jgi:hypothetical protein
MNNVYELFTSNPTYRPRYPTNRNLDLVNEASELRRQILNRPYASPRLVEEENED